MADKNIYNDPRLVAYFGLEDYDSTNPCNDYEKDYRPEDYIDVDALDD